MGVFVRSRLQAMAAHCEVKVIAPVALLDYAYIRGSGWGKFKQPIPRQRLDGCLEVFYPRWFYLPAVGALNPLFLFLFVLPKILAIRRRFDFHLIDAHFGHPSGVVAAMLAAAFSRPFTVTLRGDETMHGQRRLRRYWMGWALRRADHVITVSDRLRQFAIGLGVSAARSTTIPNGIDTTIYYPRNRHEMRSKHNIPVDTKMLLTAGYLIQRKGHHRAIRALNVLRTQGMAVRLWIVGGPGREGLFEETLRHLVRELKMEDAVTFVGPVPSHVLAEYMSAADVFCLASTREGWPNVVHEALGCGTPVVATDVGGIPDLVPSEAHGFVVPIDDQDALEDGLRKAFSRGWDRDIISARAQARPWAKVATEVLTQMQRIVIGESRSL
jgi:glycosyltransferase involved in cell wall biosynthesis